MPMTMQEIARKLNISVSTVSRALSGQHDKVSKDTKNAILTLARKHGVQRRRTMGKNVAFVIDRELFNDCSNFYSSLISGIETELIKNRYYFQFNSVDRINFDLKDINLNFSDIIGVIFVGFYHDNLVLELKNRSIPIVLLDYHLPTEDIDSVLIDNTDGVLKACRYLSELGHSRIAYISGDKALSSSQERLFGYRRAKELFDLLDDPSLHIECNGRIDQAHEAMNRILDSSTRLTAVITHNDVFALGAMDAIKQRGLAVPEDISVIGFDDIAMARQMAPSLTTVHVPKHTMGIMAVRRLLHITEGKEYPNKKILIPTKLKIRNSTASPKD